MRLSTRSRYGVRMMFELGLYYGKGPLFLKEIAKRQELSEKYLSNIVIPLKGNGLVNSILGAHGGYLLKRPPETITIKEIIEALEGDVNIVECVKNPSVCSRIRICSSRDMWVDVNKRIHEALNSVTLKDLVAQYRKKHKNERYEYTNRKN